MTARPPRQPPGASSTGPETGAPEGLSRNLHDSFFKSVFGDPVLAAGELGAVLPPDLVARIDWPSLAPAPANFVGALFRQRVGDLVFQARFKTGGELLLWCLLEHQRRQDPWMLLRIVDTESKMWQRWRRINPRDVQLPAIVPVVVYHGHEPWTSATAMRELYALPEDTHAAFGDHLLSCSFALDDLSRLDDDSLRSRRMEIFAKLSLLALARGQREMLLRQLGQRFGVLPAAVTARVNEAGATDLGRWAERILDAKSLDDVFAGV